MLEDRPSMTAQRVAMRRAIHQIWDHPKVLDDPIAAKIIGREASAEISAFPPSDSPFSITLRAFLVARSRYAEERLAAAVERGVRQYVVLGAGLDTFAYRNPFPALRVFEVDHPATQAWKRRRVSEGEIPLPGSLTFVPVDFEKDTLAEALARTGFDSRLPAFFSWLGVTPYLVRATVAATLSWIAAACPASAVAFDYAVPPESLAPPARLSFAELASRVAALGEPFISFFDPPELARELHGMGYRQVEDLGASEINRLYFGGRADKLRVAGVGRLVCARGE